MISYNQANKPNLTQAMETPNNSQETIPLTQVGINNEDGNTTSSPDLELDLTGLFDVPVTTLDGKEEKVDVRQKIQNAKRFYLDHFNYQINLNHDSYVRLSGITDFNVGYKYKNLVEKMDKVETLTQLVNERYKLRTVCKTMYYREASLKLDTGVNKDLLTKYLGLGLNDIKSVVKQELKENSWFLKVYRDRLLFISERLKSNFNLTSDEIKSVRDYDDILKFVL